jgi:hypothetical protein
MSAQLYDLTVRRLCGDPRSFRVLEIAMYELANAASSDELLRSVARITGIGECRLQRRWGGKDALKVAAMRLGMTLALG